MFTTDDLDLIWRTIPSNYYWLADFKIKIFGRSFWKVSKEMAVEGISLKESSQNKY